MIEVIFRGETVEEVKALASQFINGTPPPKQHSLVDDGLTDIERFVRRVWNRSGARARDWLSVAARRQKWTTPEMAMELGVELTTIRSIQANLGRTIKSAIRILDLDGQTFLYIRSDDGRYFMPFEICAEIDKITTNN